jgi:type II secretory pathway predicted ATPase ExeA
MYSDMMKYYGLEKDLDKADYFETENYKNMLSNIKVAIKSGGIIALTGVVGTGKTVTLRRIQQAMREENKIHVVKSLASDKRQVIVKCQLTFLVATTNFAG